MAQWIRRTPPKGEIRGSNPRVGFTFCCATPVCAAVQPRCKSAFLPHHTEIILDICPRSHATRGSSCPLPPIHACCPTTQLASLARVLCALQTVPPLPGLELACKDISTFLPHFYRGPFSSTCWFTLSLPPVKSSHEVPVPSIFFYDRGPWLS